MSNIPEQYQGPGYGTVYGDSEARPAIAIAEIDALVNGGGGSGGGGDASADNQELQIALETEIRDRLPAALINGKLAVSLPSDVSAIAGTDITEFGLIATINTSGYSGVYISIDGVILAGGIVALGSIQGNQTALKALNLNTNTTVSILTEGLYYIPVNFENLVLFANSDISGSCNINYVLSAKNYGILPSDSLEISNDSDNPIPVNGVVGISGSLPAFENTPTFKVDQTNPGVTNKVNIGDDGTVASTQSGTWNINNISGTISLPTGASTSDLQTTGNTAIQSILTELPSTTNPVLVRNISNKFREDFAGSSLDPAVWSTIQTGAGQAITVSNSELTITSGTTINSETIIRSLTSFTIPMRVCFTFTISQRIANQEIYFEITDSAGNNVSRLLFSGTSTNIALTQTVNNASSLASTALTLLNNTNTYSILDCDLGIDAIDFYPRGVDSSAVRGTGTTKTRFLPDPNQLYYLQIRVKNLSSAPASTTTLTIDSITVQDVEEFSVEVNGGRGGGNASQGVPVSVVSSANTQNVSIVAAGVNVSTIDTSSSQVIESTVNLSAGSTFTGSSRNTSSLRNYIRGWIFTDQPGTLTIEQSVDSATWRQVYSLNVAASSTAVTLYETKIYTTYYRIKFTNTGASTQTAMQLISCTFNG